MISNQPNEHPSCDRTDYTEETLLRTYLQRAHDVLPLLPQRYRDLILEYEKHPHKPLFEKIGEDFESSSEEIRITIFEA